MKWFSASSKGQSLTSITLRYVALLAFVLAATWASYLLRGSLNLEVSPENEQQMHRVIMMGSIAYIGLLALPFVPGAEIGLAMMTLFGAEVAPLVYASTVAAMMLSYTVGRLLPIAVLVRLLSFLRLRRAANLVARAAPLSQDARIEMLLSGAPPRAVELALRHRYLALALVVNLPGNALIGGGGGIMMIAGLSRIFAPLPTSLTVAIAVAPVPLIFLFFGA